MWTANVTFIVKQVMGDDLSDEGIAIGLLAGTHQIVDRPVDTMLFMSDRLLTLESNIQQHAQSINAIAVFSANREIV